MLTFYQYINEVKEELKEEEEEGGVEQLQEKILSIGLNPKHDKYREQYRKDFHNLLHKTYSHPDVGGYSGHKSGSKEESDAIHRDITDAAHIKATRRNGRITAVQLYKKQHGRKAIAGGREPDEEGRKDIRKQMSDDHVQKRAWGEVSGAPEHVRRKMGVPVIHNAHAAKLTGKEIEANNPDQEHYTRKIGGHSHEKVIMGHPKVDLD